MATLTTLVNKDWTVHSYTRTDATYEHKACNMRVTKERDDYGLVYPPQVCPFCLARELAVADDIRKEEAGRKEKKND